ELAASGLPFQETYKSGVIAWAPSDNPSPAEIDSVVDDFLSLCFGGLDPCDFSSVVYLHRSKDKVDVHVLVANVHIPTGKHFNCASPGWQKDFDPLRDMWNYRKGWARPDDPRRAREYQPGKAVAISSARIKTGVHVEPDVKALLAGYIDSGIRRGEITCQEDVVSALSKVGVINRVGENYVSVIPDGQTKPVRLKGTHFSAAFNAVMPTPSLKSREAHSIDPDTDRTKELKAKAMYEEGIARRTQYNLRRFRQSKSRKLSATAPNYLAELDLSTVKVKDLAIAGRLKTISDVSPKHPDHINLPDPKHGTQSLEAMTKIHTSPSRIPEENYESDKSTLENLFGRLILRVREGFEQLRRTSCAVREAMRTLEARASGDESSHRNIRTPTKKLPRPGR
ncbi:MAG: hypothetical protein EON56_00495, partial [Alphaproteobacteria bacterium]